MELRRAFVLCAVIATGFGAGALVAQTSPPPSASDVTPEAARALAEIGVAARAHGTSSDGTFLAPGFVFVHSTGVVDDRAGYLAFVASGRAAGGGPGVDLQPPIVRLDGDVLLRIRHIADQPAPGGDARRLLRVLDVYVRRAGGWQWLAHETVTTAPSWTPVVVADRILDEVAGSYQAAGGVRRSFVRRGNTLVQLMAGAGSTNGERPMVPLSEATFGYSALTSTITFVRDGTGRVVGADESNPAGLNHFTRVAQ